MKTIFSKTWNRSVQTRKQRKFRFNAPLHIKRKFMSVHLSKDLRQKHNIRAILVKKDDIVKIMRGDHKAKESKVTRVSHKHNKVYLEDLFIAKKDGSKKNFGIDPSNLMITKLDLNGKKRLSKVERKSKIGQKVDKSTKTKKSNK